MNKSLFLSSIVFFQFVMSYSITFPRIFHEIWRHKRYEPTQNMTTNLTNPQVQTMTNNNKVNMVEHLVVQSWKYLLDDEVWGEASATSETTCGKASVWTHQLPCNIHGSENLMIKTKAVVHGTPQDIFDMFYNSSRAKEYNKYSVGRTDIDDKVGGKSLTKVVWSRTKPPATKRPHDFCTLMHGLKYSNGTYVLFSTAIDHPKAPLSPQYLRSEILLGATLMIPVGNGMTELTSINHVKSHGIPVFLCNKLSPTVSLGFLREVDALFIKNIEKTE